MIIEGGQLILFVGLLSGSARERGTVNLKTSTTVLLQVSLLPILLALLSSPLQAKEMLINSVNGNHESRTDQYLPQEQPSNDAGFFVGAGGFIAGNSSCTYCDYSGRFFEIGYDFNNSVGVEAKFASGRGDNGFGLKINYAGVNLGHDFNSGWFRLYGKAGLATIVEERLYSDSYSYSAATLGVGVRFVFSGRPSGVYLKIESMAVPLQDGSVDAATILGLGYRF